MHLRNEEIDTHSDAGCVTENSDVDWIENESQKRRHHIQDSTAKKSTNSINLHKIKGFLCQVF